MGYIDAHVHVWTTDMAHYPLAPGIKPEEMKPRSFTPQELFQYTQPAGVDRINLIQVYFYGFDNRYLLDMIALYPDTFVGTATIDPSGPDPAGLMTALARKKVRAFRIEQLKSRHAADPWLEPAGYAVMFAAGAKNNQAMSCLMYPNGLPDLERMCKKYPDTPVVIDHLCRIGLDGAIRARDVDALCAMAKYPRLFVKIGTFYALGKRQPPYTDLAPLIRRVVQAFGARRCMWESGYPDEDVEHQYTDSLDLVRRRLDFLTDQDRDWLLQRTAAEFFFKK
jgi:predicted TIM-barrel fold metal-dependent hydrolase